VVSRSPGWAELWWVELDEPIGRRPGLVLSRPEAAAVMPRLLVAFATTKVRGLPSEVALGPNDGLPQECVVNLDTPEMLSRYQLVEFIGSLSALRWHEVCAATSAAIGCA
jgi:mRNA interferase MazF